MSSKPLTHGELFDEAMRLLARAQALLLDARTRHEALLQQEASAFYDMFANTPLVSAPVTESACTTNVAGRLSMWPEPAYVPTQPVEVDVSVKTVPWSGAVNVSANGRHYQLPDGGIMTFTVGEPPKQHFWRCEHYPVAISNWARGSVGCIDCDPLGSIKRLESELRETRNECKPATSSR